MNNQLNVSAPEAKVSNATGVAQNGDNDVHQTITQTAPLALAQVWSNLPVDDDTADREMGSTASYLMNKLNTALKARREQPFEEGYTVEEARALSTEINKRTPWDIGVVCVNKSDVAHLPTYWHYKNLETDDEYDGPVGDYVDRYEPLLEIKSEMSGEQVCQILLSNFEAEQGINVREELARSVTLPTEPYKLKCYSLDESYEYLKSLAVKSTDLVLSQQDEVCWVGKPRFVSIHECRELFPNDAERYEGCNPEMYIPLIDLEIRAFEAEDVHLTHIGEIPLEDFEYQWGATFPELQSRCSALVEEYRSKIYTIGLSKYASNWISRHYHQILANQFLRWESGKHNAGFFAIEDVFLLRVENGKDAVFVDAVHIASDQGVTMDLSILLNEFKFVSNHIDIQLSGVDILQLLALNNAYNFYVENK